MFAPLQQVQQRVQRPKAMANDIAELAALLTLNLIIDNWCRLYILSESKQVVSAATAAGNGSLANSSLSLAIASAAY